MRATRRLRAPVPVTSDWHRAAVVLVGATAAAAASYFGTAEDWSAAILPAKASDDQSRDAIAFRMISAASAASAGLASSSGEWLIPSLHGTKTIALGTWSATHIVSCAAPDGISMYGSPVARAATSSAWTILPSSGIAGSVW